MVGAYWIYWSWGPLWPLSKGTWSEEPGITGAKCDIVWWWTARSPLGLWLLLPCTSLGYCRLPCSTTFYVSTSHIGRSSFEFAQSIRHYACKCDVSKWCFSMFWGVMFEFSSRETCKTEVHGILVVLVEAWKWWSKHHWFHILEKHVYHFGDIHYPVIRRDQFGAVPAIFSESQCSFMAAA